jgi:deazaflavin-dependent oxidoreductase (nitroreductase family)
MPIPMFVARINRVLTNRVAMPFAGRLPGFGVIRHAGRRSGRPYRTPVNVFRQRDGGYVVALTYGPGADWVQNVVAGNGCVLQVRGRLVRLVEPQLVHDETRRCMPPVVRQLLGLLGVADFLRLAVAPDDAERREYVVE